MTLLVTIIVIMNFCVLMHLFAIAGEAIQFVERYLHVTFDSHWMVLSTIALGMSIGFLILREIILTYRLLREVEYRRLIAYRGFKFIFM